MEDIKCLLSRKRKRLKNLKDDEYDSPMYAVKRNNEIYRLKGYCEALSDVKNKKVYTQERDILERIYNLVPENIQEIIRECWR